MANDIDLYDGGGDIAPYDPGMPVLAPLSPSPDTWGRTDLDVLTPREIDQGQSQPGGVQLFGSPMPAGTSQRQVDAMLGQLGGAFMADFSTLGFPTHMVQAAIGFVTANATKTPYSVVPKHGFKLHGHDDWLGNAFGNMVQTLSGTPRQKQQFVTACLQWLAKASKQLNTGREPAPRTAPTPSVNPLSQLTDTQFDTLIKHNENVKARTMGILQQKWGEYSFQQNIDIAQNYLASLPAHEQKHFDQWTGNFPWVHSLNTVEVLEFLYNSAIGANNIPKDGAGIASEIAAFESMLKVPAERAKYMRDPQLQARLRELYQRRGG